MITHTIATIEDFLIMEGFSMDMKRTRICGIPKYPSPHPRPLRMSCQLVIENTAAECTLCHSSCGCISIFIYSGKESGFAVIQIRIDRWQKAGNDCSGKQYPHVLQW